MNTPPTPIPALPRDGIAPLPEAPPTRRRGTWTPARQSSISALFRLASSVHDNRVETRGRRAHTLNDTVGPRRTRLEPQRGRRATTGQIPTVVRWVSTFVGAPVDATFWCQICFENVGISEAFTLEACGHQYCRSCFAMHLEQKIDEGDAYPLCFHPVLRDEDGENDRLHGRNTCGTGIPESAIVELCGPEVWARYEAQRSQDEDEDVCECPYCYHSQTTSHADERDVVCASCSRTYCTLHGSAHENTSCGDYEFSAVREYKVHHAATSKNAKPCPTCKAHVEKTGDCNHMRCLMCTTSFCWLCGDHIDDGLLPSHYDWAGQSSCRGKQWDTSTNPSLSDQVLGVMWRCVVTVICFLPALVWSLVTRCQTSNKGYRQVFAETYAVCERWFRTFIHFAVFVVFRWLVLLICVVPALVLTIVFKLFACVGTKSWRRFFNRDIMTVFTDLDLMLATGIFTFLCGIAVGLALVIGFIMRAGDSAVHYLKPRPSTSDTFRAEHEQDEVDRRDLEAGSRTIVTPDAIESSEETAYIRIQEA